VQIWRRGCRAAGFARQRRRLGRPGTPAPPWSSA